jgi:hypothetical protein
VEPAAAAGSSLVFGGYPPDMLSAVAGTCFVIAGTCLVASSFWMRASLMPRMRGRAIQRGTVGRWDADAGIRTWTSWAVSFGGALVVVSGILMIA